jgi:uncharacterized tellurite resistance protein B-like protein
MPVKSIREWLGLGRDAAAGLGPLDDTLDALDHLDPAQARYLAAFAYLLGRAAHADRHVSVEETETMERHVCEEGRLSPGQATLVVTLAKRSNLLFGGTADFLVAREFANMASYDQKLALMQCIFAVCASDADISMSEEGEIHRIARELKIQHEDMIALRVQYRRHLPGVNRSL